MKRLILAIAALALSSPALAAPINPPPLAANSSLVDAADILTPEQEMQVEAQARDIYNRTHHHVVVLTMPTLDGYPVQDYINNAFRYYKIGNAERNDGVLLLVSMNNPRRLQIEVGYGLEGVLTDADSMLITEGMKPMMKAGDFADAINYGVKQIGDQITEEVVTPQTLAATQGAKAKDDDSSSVLGIFLFLGAIAIIGGMFYLFIYLPRKRLREAAEAEERQRLRDEEIERRRVAAERSEREWRESQQQQARERDERDRRARMFTNSQPTPSITPKPHRRLPPVPSHDRAAQNASAAAAAEAERQRRAREESDRRERNRRDEEDRQRRNREDEERRQRDSWSSSSSSSWGSSSSSSSSSDWGSSSGGFDSGGSSGGGGGGSDW